MRITVQAWAWRTPLGRGREALERLRRGEVASRSADRCGISLLAEIPEETPRLPESRYLHRAGLFALEVAREVGVGGERAGVFAGIGGLRALWEDLGVAMRDQRGGPPWAEGLGKVHPYWMLRHLSNNAHALIAQSLGAKGEGTTVSGPTGGAGALAAAIRALQTGRLEVATVVAADSLLQPELLLEGAVTGRWASSFPAEAAIAVRLGVGDGPAVGVRGGVEVVPGDDAVVRAMGDMGAATALAQLVWLVESGGGVAISGGAPGLGARVEVS